MSAIPAATTINLPAVHPKIHLKAELTSNCKKPELLVLAKAWGIKSWMGVTISKMLKAPLIDAILFAQELAMKGGPNPCANLGKLTKADLVQLCIKANIKASVSETKAVLLAKLEKAKAKADGKSDGDDDDDEEEPLVEAQRLFEADKREMTRQRLIDLLLEAKSSVTEDIDLKKCLKPALQDYVCQVYGWAKPTKVAKPVAKVAGGITWLEFLRQEGISASALGPDSTLTADEKASLRFLYEHQRDHPKKKVAEKKEEEKSE